MQLSAATINCPNYTCEEPNPEHNKFCEKCRTPLPKRYLWVVGTGIKKVKEFNLGEILADRYVIKGDRLLLDTQPGKVPDLPMEIPDSIVPYLRLFTHRTHIPQVYGQLVDEKIPNSDLWLLEQGPIYSDIPTESANEANGSKKPEIGQFMPHLIGQWAKASPLRQLNWLWQIANLWQPFVGEGVAGSLLNPELIRVEGPIIRLLELRIDVKFPNLADLGKLWQVWVPTANPLIKPFLEKLCQLLIDEEIKTSDQLIQLLDRGLTLCGQLYERQYAIATGTDQGPSRRRNEDACYPKEANTKLTNDPGLNSLAIVCDGIGGHEGGNVASNMAIEAVKNYIQQQQKSCMQLDDPQTLSLILESAAAAANQDISQKNDSQQKQGRQRMGTTLVMSYANAHELYITHVGDSRAYWINQTGCRQVTIDDDVASRHVCFGYVLYRDALQQPASGSLVQALGMGPSSHLHPSVERFIIDEDSLFLLCSDGLSDNDRVEQYWQEKILPILTGESLSQGVHRLIDLANYHNGHDNVTVALVHCRVSPNEKVNLTPEELVAQLEAIPEPLTNPDTHPDADTELPKPEVSGSAPTKLIQQPKPALSLLPILLGIIFLLGLAGIAAWKLGIFGEDSESSETNSAIVNVPNNEPEPQQLWDRLTIGKLYQINLNPESSLATSVNISLYQENQQNSEELEEMKQLEIGESGSVIISVEEKPENLLEDKLEQRIKVRVCPLEDPIDDRSSTGSAEVGWIKVQELESLENSKIIQVGDYTGLEIDQCAKTNQVENNPPDSEN